MSEEVGERVLRLSAQRDHPRLEVPNLEELSQSLLAQAGLRPNDEPIRQPIMAPPTVRLRVSEPGFAPDYLTIGLHLISARARQILALGDQDGQYLEVDTSDCTPEVIAQDYRALVPLKTADPLDKERSDGCWRDVYHLDDRVERLWRLRMPDPNAGPLRIVWKDEFSPPGPIFIVLGPGWLLATEALAARAQAADLTGLAFIDLQNDGSGTATVERTDTRGN